MKFNCLERYVATEEPIIIGLPQNLRDMTALEEVDSLLNGILQEVIEGNILSTKFGEVTTTAATVQTEVKKVIAVGLGDADNINSEKLHILFGELFQHLKETDTSSGQILLDTFPKEDSRAEALGYMSQVSVYEFDNYKKDRSERFLSRAALTITTREDVSAQVDHGKKIGEGVNAARDISETPPNFMTPKVCAEHISALFNDSPHITGDVKNDEALEEEGFGLMTAVGKASVNKPRLVTIEYKHPEASDHKPVALVGKGVTYDSGGYSIKSKSGMAGMKYDLSGAANVIGMLRAIVSLELPVHVVGIVALAENMIDGSGMKPDDVFKSYSGHTVEVKNTDAEGRLVLGDAVFHASQYSPAVIMDFATLTGAVVAALGDERTGVFTNRDQDLVDPIFTLSREIGEVLWRLPLSEIEEKKVTSSDVADLTNHVEGQGKASFAACFIEQFSNRYPWIHFDIAGTGTRKKQTPFGPKGATGVLIRTIVKYMEGDNARRK